MDWSWGSLAPTYKPDRDGGIEVLCVCLVPRGRNRPPRASWPFVKRDADSVDKIEGSQEKTPSDNLRLLHTHVHVHTCAHKHGHANAYAKKKKEV